MEVLDHEPWGWSLLVDDGRLLLDVHVSHGPVSSSLVIALDDTERTAYRTEGRAYLHRLAAQVQDSAPLAAGSASPYRARDLTAEVGPELTRKVVAWRERHATGTDTSG
ncbi:hypothetical protein H9657_03850 [Cellulomonas sp. Sa3CUA2]|uniref:Uncharacterized protein n=1 Tax=Cellulomonas avistercoris TaxID=2762242 RepID=A0ABR8QAE7_9CELL|nr:hypothetical protein [Cellulomonas avistercoris]MBD7917413.1 hypothetical protein [Cellulomonas avistercoris]